MAEFTFNLDQLKSSVGSSVTSLDSKLYSKTRDQDLNYTGNDYIIWDRTNAERIRRGLPSLTEIGFPRPPEDTTIGTTGATGTPATGAAPTNPDGTAKTFAIKGPPGLTREQAFAIFKKQADTGGLVGFTPGETLSASTQAADGLAGAQAIVAQAQSGINGSINSLGGFSSSLSASGVDLSTGRIPSVDSAFAKGGINGGAAGLGAVVGSVASGLGSAGGALGGSLAGITPGLTAAVGPAVSSVSGALGGVVGSSQLGLALVGASAVQGSVAVTSIQTINKTITGLPVTSPINVADFSKIASGINSVGAVAPIGPMSIPEVNGVLAQAKNLTGQGFGDLSDANGLGAFGLNLGQLESAGYVKPGTRAKFNTDLSTFSTVINSPAVWTGKDGVKNAGDLLANASKQSQIQQDLMTKGVAGMGAVGIPVQNLSSQGIAGMSLNAAKDLPSAEAFAKGLPIPGDGTGAVQAEFATAVRDGAFAVNLVNTKIPTAFKQQEVPKPASDTVGRATVDAATTRVIGDDKVPAPNYTAKQVTENTADVELYVNTAKTLASDYINPTNIAFTAIANKLTALENQQTITSDAWSAINNEFQEARNLFNSNGPTLQATLESIYTRLSPGQQQGLQDTGKFTNIVNIRAAKSILLDKSKNIKQRLAALSLKIEGRGAGE